MLYPSLLLSPPHSPQVRPVLGHSLVLRCTATLADHRRIPVRVAACATQEYQGLLSLLSVQDPSAAPAHRATARQPQLRRRCPAPPSVPAVAGRRQRRSDEVTAEHAKTPGAAREADGVTAVEGDGGGCLGEECQADRADVLGG